MQNVNIRTAQNVGINYELAGLGSRIGAFAVDALIQAVYVIIVMFSLSYIILSTSGSDSIWIYSLFYLPILFYHLISEIVLNGQSIGKKQFNIKVVRLDGSSPTLGGYIMRWMLRIIDISIFSGAIALISVALSKSGQRLGDMAAGTTVVKCHREVKVTSHQLINNLDTDYQVTFPQVRQLTDSEIDVIKEALTVNRTSANSKPVLAIANKLQSHLDIQSDLPPVKLLYTVVKDYKFITSQI